MLPVLTALITPFDTDGSVDYKSLENIIKHQLEGGCGIVLFGTTGECPTLDCKERIKILRLVIEKFPADIHNFVIGVGGYNTQECVENVLVSKTLGFEKIMITCPYYNKPNQKGLKAHFEHICKRFMETKFIIYNIPGRTGVNLLPETFHQICLDNTNVIGIKEASGDLNQMIKVKRLCPNILLYSGDDSLLIPTLSIGGHGVISVISNLMPKKINYIVKLYNTSKQSEAFEEYLKYDELIRLMFVETNPSPIKFIMKAKGLIETDNVRLPMVPMTESDNKSKILNYLD